MTIDTNELRRLAQAATPGPWKMLPVGDGRQKFAVADSEFLSILTVTDEGGATFGTVRDDDDARFIAAANPAAISELLDRLEAAEKERTIDEQRIADLMADLNRVGHENDALRAKIEAIEKQEPVGVLHVGSCYGEELEDWEFEANQCACDKLNEAYVSNPTSLPLYALPGAQAQPVKNAVAYLDLGVGGYMDIGTDLTDEELAALPKGRHMLGIIGTYGLDGYVPAQNVPDFADAYQGAMEEVAIWKKRALEAEDLNRKFIAEINGPTHMGEPVQNVPRCSPALRAWLDRCGL